MDPQARLRALYGVMQSIENKLGGGEGVEGLYGSINNSGMQKILDALAAKCGLDGSSRLVDIGAGLGRPLLHALVEPGIASACGVEIDRIKCDKAAAFLRHTVGELERRGVSSSRLEEPEIQCKAIEQIKTLDPCTHAYSFWEGVPYDGKLAFGRLFAGSRTLRAVAVVQRAMRGRQDPAAVMEELGFGQLELVASFSVSMSGSGRSFTAYVFNRADAPAPLPAGLAVEAALAEELQGEAQLATPAQSGEGELACPADSSSQQQTAATDLADSAARPAVGAGGGHAVAPAPQQQQQPALGRGLRRATRSRKAAEASEAAAAADAATAAEAEAGAADRAEPKAGGRKAGTPQKPRGVQKKQSPAKKAPAQRGLLLPDARVRRTGAALPAAASKAKTRSTKSVGVEEPEAPQPAARRGLLA